MSGLYNLRDTGSATSGTDDGATLFLAAKELLRRVRVGIKNGLISVNRDSHTISNLFVDGLRLYSDDLMACHDKALPKGRSEDALRMLNYMKDTLRLDLTPNHYAAVIRVACAEQKWTSAANIFRIQMKDFAGYVPMDVHGEALELGLYAVAKSIQREVKSSNRPNSDVSEELFDVARTLAIASPMDLDGYLLAAVKTLGSIGDWQAALSFYQSNKSMGEPLLAAVMRACLKSGKYSEALSLFEGQALNDYESTGAFREAVNDVRNSLFQAYGLDIEGGKSLQAKKLFDELKITDHIFSSRAVSGILTACEKDLDWAGLLQVAEHFITPISDNDGQTFNLNDILLPLLRCCNNLEKFEISVLYVFILCFASKNDNLSIMIDEGVPQIIPSLFKQSALLKAASCTDYEEDSIENALLLGAHYLYQDTVTEIIRALEGLNEFDHAMGVQKMYFERSNDLDFAAYTANDESFPYKNKSGADSLHSEFFTWLHENVAFIGRKMSMKETLEQLTIMDCSKFGEVGLVLLLRHLGFSKIPSDGELLESLCNDRQMHSVMSLLRLNGRSEDAVTLFLNKVERHALHDNEWWNSFSLSLELLVELGRGPEAYSLIANCSLNSAEVEEISSRLKNIRGYKALMDLFVYARRRQILTNEIVVNTLLAVGKTVTGSDKRAMYSSIIDTYCDSAGISTDEWLYENQFFIATDIPRKEWGKIFQWKGSEVRRKEFELLYTLFDEFRSDSSCILESKMLVELMSVLGYLQRHKNCRGKPLRDSETPREARKQVRQRQEGIENVIEVLQYTKEHGLDECEDVILGAVMALRALKGHDEVLETVQPLFLQDPV
eukprot:CAMPEP_0116049796 /NCGR_PEP_ID=MMETSP0322-20121206/12_1 /TAXON_ID=163516 /ORGANISM="Leptocylindrus danicus var. apora, Strain B651" /LENGTH=836 /DNA_ID=CAMNT_0003532251 /DNA_START=533 /DNA_END=3044 /DNA_ORIENTATION=+